MEIDSDWDGPDDYTGDYDCYDDDPYEPEPEGDWEQAEAYYRLAEHEEKVHMGQPCDCHPSALSLLGYRLRTIAGWFPGVYWKARYASRQPWTLRLGPVEVTVRPQAGRSCGACSGRGWFYSIGTVSPVPPPGCSGVSLCGCGSAIRKLADSRRAVRRMRKEVPF